MSLKAKYTTCTAARYHTASQTKRKKSFMRSEKFPTMPSMLKTDTARHVQPVQLSIQRKEKLILYQIKRV